MTAQEFIIEKLNQLAQNFEGIRIRYEFRESKNSHIIEICPVEIFERNTQYMLSEAELESEFESRFPCDEIYFITNGSLIDINKVTFTRGYYTISILSGSRLPEIIFEGYTDIIPCRIVNYAIAA